MCVSHHNPTAPAFVVSYCSPGDASGGLLGAAFDELVFNNIRQELGGRVQYMTTGENCVSIWGDVCQAQRHEQQSYSPAAAVRYMHRIVAESWIS